MNIEKKIVSTPINFPKLVPDDWDKWWNIWNRYSTPLVKKGISPNNQSGLHVGFDVFKISVFSPTYEAAYVDLSVLYPSLYEQIVSLPMQIYGARFVSSKGDFPGHIDNRWISWSLRNMFHCEDPEPQWFYTDMENKNKTFLTLPESTNWWAYLDGAIKHGTHYKENYPKIILQVFSDPVNTTAFVEKSIGMFPEHSIEYDIRN